MVARNDVTGHAIKSRVSDNENFAANWDAIFGKKKEPEVVEETTQVVNEAPAVDVHED